MSIHGDHEQIPVSVSADLKHVNVPIERLSGYSMDELLRQAAAWRDHIDDLKRDFSQRHIPTEEPVNLRKRCLETALKYTQTDRNQVHGSPGNNFSNIANYWNAHLHARYGEVHGYLHLDAIDVAIMMIGMKAARLSFNPTHEDSWIDTAGYAACGMEIALSRVDKPDPLP